MATLPDIDIQAYENAIPNSLKPQGSEKLGIIIYNQGKVIQELLTPVVLNFISQALTEATGVLIINGVIDLSPFIPNEYSSLGTFQLNIQDVVNKKIPQDIQLLLNGEIPFKTIKFLLSNPVLIKLVSKLISEKTNFKTDNGIISVPYKNDIININVIDIIDNNLSQIPPEIQNTVVPKVRSIIDDTLNKNLCKPNIQKLIIQRNALVTQLNTIGSNLDKITKSITGLSTFLNLVLTLIKTISIAKTTASAAAKAIPLIPGAVPAALSDLEDAKNKLTFTETGISKLDKTQKTIASAGISISLVNGYILTIVGLLNLLDFFLNKACPNATFESISKGIKDSASAQQQAGNTLNQTTYEGFIIEIEEVPYTATVTRRRAIGKNQQGIILTQTELSFTTNPLTLINELKLIIDRDNLKAY